MKTNNNIENSHRDLLKEFYARANNNPSQFNVTKDTEIWVYNLDRGEFTPHCHIFNKDRSQEIEVSLINWNIINVKSPKGASNDWKNFKEFQDRFFKWLFLPDEQGNSNAFKLFRIWDECNSESSLQAFISKHEGLTINDELSHYLNRRQNYLKSIYKQVHNALFAKYYSDGMSFPFKKLSPLNLLKELDVGIVVDENDSEAINAIIEAEDFVYKTL